MATDIKIGDRVYAQVSDAIGDTISNDDAVRNIGPYQMVAIWPYTWGPGNGRGAWVVQDILPNNGIYPLWPSDEPLAYLKVRGHHQAQRIVPCSRLVQLPKKPIPRQPTGNPPFTISDSRLAALRARIKPVMHLIDKDMSIIHGKLMYVAERNPRKHSFSYDPIPLSPATGLTEVADIVTYHDFEMDFKPSVAEVLAQLPPDLENQVVAFEVDCDDNEPDVVHYRGESYFTTITTLYAASATGS